VPLTLDNIVRSNTGSFDAASGSADLGAVGTDAGNAVLIIAGLGGDNVTSLTMTTPAGFTAVQGLGASSSQGRVHAFILPSASAGEGIAGSTPWTLAVSGGSTQCAWAVFEITNVDSGTDWGSGRVYISPGMSDAGGSTVTSKLLDCLGSISQTYSGIALAGFFAAETTPTTPTIGGFTGGFAEYVTQTVSNVSRAHRLTVAARNVASVGEVACTAAISPASYVSGWMLVFTGLDSHHVPDLLTCFGAEIGTGTNIATSTLLDAVVAPFDEVVGTPAVVATSPRSGGFCLEFSSTSAAESVAWAQRTFPAKGSLGHVGITTLPAVWVDRLHVYFPTALPSVDVDFGSIEVGTLANGMQVWYRAATQKLGVKIGTGTEVASDAVVVADRWIGIDRRYDPRTTTHMVDWAVDYDATPGDTTPGVPQAQASTAGMTAGGISKVRYGHTSAVTAAYRMDDIAASKFRKTYPIGDIRVVPLKVDPAGTPAVVGTAANFKTFTANGTMAAWTAADTRTALANIPPVVGAAATGIAQVTNASTEYVEVPMETFACAPDYAPVGGRWYWAGWAASGNPAQFGFKCSDVKDVSLLGYGPVNPTDAEFDNSTLRWVTVVHRQNSNAFYQFTQAVVDSLAAWLGFSNDTNPDAGVLGVVFELVVQAGVAELVMGEAGSVQTTAVKDPTTGAILSVTLDTPADRGATLRWIDSGGSGSQAVSASSSFTRSFPAAVDVSEVTRLEVESAPEDADRY